VLAGLLAGEEASDRGNHDYWWSSISKVRRSLPQGVYALQNDHFCWEDWIICGTRAGSARGKKALPSPETRRSTSGKFSA